MRLSKSVFKIAHNCPTKLYYNMHKDVYSNSSLDDSFLEALAEGGFQIGALAKCYFPDGIDLDGDRSTTGISKTTELLKQDKVTIFEGAISYGNLLVRIDILVKNGNDFELIEVKSKSFGAGDSFWNKNGTMTPDWEPYLIDVAFQKHVLQLVYPAAKIQSFLMLADKTKIATVNGLNQHFMLNDVDGQTKVTVKKPLDTGTPILTKYNVDNEVQSLINKEYELEGNLLKFDKYVDALNKSIENDTRLTAPLSKSCFGCEFDSAKENGKKSGFLECWTSQTSYTEQDLRMPNAMHIWNFRRKDHLLAEGKLRMKDLFENDIAPNGFKIPDKPGLTTHERQWMQVTKVKNNDFTHFLDRNGIAEEMRTWTYPLHFIDFETCMVAIPFYVGQHPYEQVAFQFSHHTISKEGAVTHQTEWINADPGAFPNFDFVRALKNALEKDEGTIFRYSSHENTVLNQISVQLEASNETDKEDLIFWISTITKQDEQTGYRCMVDLLELVKSYYYHPSMGGSNSIKAVLPAILKSSDYVQQKYSAPTYQGLNFKQHVWLNKDENGQIISPYKQLPKVYKNISEDEIEAFLTHKSIENIADGGAAMTAYARMQFTEMSEQERKYIIDSLLRYCELDTLAMVMIYEAWREWVR